MYRPLLSYVPNSKYGEYEDLIARLKASDVWETFKHLCTQSEALNNAYDNFLEYVNCDNSVHTHLKLREMADIYNALWKDMAEDALGIKKANKTTNLDVKATNVNIFFATPESKQDLRDLKEMIKDYGLEEEVAEKLLEDHKDLYVNLSIASDKFRRGSGDKEEVEALQREYNDIWADIANNLLFSEASLHKKLNTVAMTPGDIGCIPDEVQQVERPSQMREDNTTNSYALGLEKNDTSGVNGFSYKLNILHPTPSLPFGSQSLLGKPEAETGTRGANTTSEGDLAEKVEMNFPAPYMFAHAAPDMVNLKTNIGYNYKGDKDDDTRNLGMGNSMGTIPADREANKLNKETGSATQPVPRHTAPNINLFLEMTKPFTHKKDHINDLDKVNVEELNQASQIECESSVKGTVTQEVTPSVKGNMKGKVTDDGSGRDTKGGKGTRGVKSLASMAVNEPASDGISQWDQPYNYKEPTDIKLFLNKQHQGNGLSLQVFKPTSNKDDFSRNMSGIGDGEASGCINQGLNHAFNMGGDLGEIGDKALGNNADAQHTQGVDVTKIGKEEEWDNEPHPQTK